MTSIYVEVAATAASAPATALTAAIAAATIIRLSELRLQGLNSLHDFDFCLVSKCLHISISRTKPAGLDF